jgi:cysteine-rich repeat protein
MQFLVTTSCSFFAVMLLFAVPGNAGAQWLEPGRSPAGSGLPAGTSGAVVCHDPCSIGAAMDPLLCGQVVTDVCARDSYCCTQSWDANCILEVASYGHDLSCGLCGDGTQEGDNTYGESCDDGNNIDGDQCSQFCELECHSECETGPSMSPACSANVTAVCAVDSYCCDPMGGWDGFCVNSVAPYAHDNSCGTCGNGEQVSPEGCDDFNNASGDQCSEFCQLECHDVCAVGPAMPAQCSQSAAEVCAYDGYCCSPSGFWDGYCVGYVAPISGNLECGLCGNGTLDLGEPCDDGNSISNDGCSSTCNIECHDICHRLRY